MRSLSGQQILLASEIDLLGRIIDYLNKITAVSPYLVAQMTMELGSGGTEERCPRCPSTLLPVCRAHLAGRAILEVEPKI